jgi:branched-chain amino acid transport system permease protein
VTRQGLILTGLGVLALIAYPWVFSSNYAINFGFLVLFAAYLGQTWNIAGGFAGQTSFGHVVFFGVGAYVSTILQTAYGVNPWIAWPFAALGGALIGWIVGVLSYRAGLKGSYFALVTLAVAEVGRIVANSVPITKGGMGILLRADPRPANFQFRDPIWFYYLALALCLVCLLIAWQLTRTRFGARLAAIRENEDAAQALGINTFREKVKCLTLSGGLCGAGGTVYAQKYLYIDPSIAFGVDKSVEMLLISMIGGAGTVLGPLIGSGVLHVVGEVTRDLGNMLPGVSNAQPLSIIVYGAVLIAIVAWLPDGLMGLLRTRRKEARRA